MKNKIKSRAKILSFISLIFIFFCYFNFSFFNISKSFNPQVFENLLFEINADNKDFKFSSNELLGDKNIKQIQLENIKNLQSRQQTYKKLLSMGFSQEDAISYVFPESRIILDKLSRLIERDCVPEDIQVIKNSCSIKFLSGYPGKFINRSKYFENFTQFLNNDNNLLKINIKTEEYYDYSNLKELFKEKGCFSTNFSSSNESRKNNIRVALRAFDGVVLDEGEVLSFNQTTGIRNESSGYMPAKIITGGTYTLGFGGGVCQVSTTLYNACLLSGLEILEVNSHSLPVSYVEPSFDAMVNVGSSDLKIRNNTNGKIIITTSSKNDICKVKIFGIKNKYKITRTSEKTKIIPSNDEIIDNDYLKYGLNDMMVGEERRVSYKKDGYYSNGYLNYYDEQGNLIKTQKIRSNKYNATTGVIVKREK